MSAGFIGWAAANAISLLAVAGIVYAAGGGGQTAFIGWLTGVALGASWDACKARNAGSRP